MILEVRLVGLLLSRCAGIFTSFLGVYPKNQPIVSLTFSCSFQTNVFVFYLILFFLLIFFIKMDE